MARITIKQYRKDPERFEKESRPTAQTVRRWCENGVLPAEQIGGPGGTWYIFADQLEDAEVVAMVERVLNG